MVQAPSPGSSRGRDVDPRGRPPPTAPLILRSRVFTSRLLECLTPSYSAIGRYGSVSLFKSDLLEVFRFGAPQRSLAL